METANLDSYESVIRRVASRLNYNGSIDSLANGRDDYESMLRLESCLLQGRFRERHGFNVNAERRYVMKGLWNASRMFDRTRRRRLSGIVRHESEPEMPPATLMDEVESVFEARNALEILERELDSDDFQILNRVAEFDGRVSHAFDPDRDGESSRSRFEKRVRRLRQRARTILSN